MIQNQLQNIEQLEAQLWDAADNLRANSRLTAGEYCMPVLGIIFLRHATSRCHAALRDIEADEQNYAEGQFHLGAAYARGEGVPKDDEEAVKWYRKAAEQNYALLKSLWGCCYLLGQGAPKDYVESYKWLLLAAGQGDRDSNKIISGLEAMMLRDQIAEGQKLARNFKPREVPPAGGRHFGHGYSGYEAGVLGHWILHLGGWLSCYE
jgi:TPR repeat protein